MPEASQPYAVGDRLRVIVDEPYNTELLTGDLVTVEKVTQDEADRLIYVVSTSYGLRYLHDDVVQPFGDEYRPSAPDEIIDAQLSAIVAADPELAAFLANAETSFGEPRPVEIEVEHGSGEHKHTWTPVGPEDHFHVTDTDDDDFDIFYAERECSEHGRTGVFFIRVNDGDTVAIPATFAPVLVMWLHQRIMHSRREDES